MLEHERYCAIGSGDDTANGAMHVLFELLPKDEQDPALMVEHALRAACKHTVTCGGKLTIHTI